MDIGFRTAHAVCKIKREGFECITAKIQLMILKKACGDLLLCG